MVKFQVLLTDPLKRKLRRLIGIAVGNVSWGLDGTHIKINVFTVCKLPHQIGRDSLLGSSKANNLVPELRDGS